jgi:hypothetical protein
MAIEWGTNSLGPRQSQGWFFVRPVASGFLPILSARPLSPSFTDGSGTFIEYLDGISFPIWPQLGVSTIWSKLSDDGSLLVYFMMVMNFSNSTVEYAFLESDL